MATGKSVPRPRRSAKRAKRPGASNDSSLSDRVQAEREQLFKVIGIVELCKLAAATSLEVSDPDYLVPAFETICDQLNACAERLEWIAADLQQPPGKDEA